MTYKDPDKQRAYQVEWQRKRREAWLTENGPCVTCGSSDRLEVDHVDPSTKVTHAVWSWSGARRLAELSKCQVLCHDCHLAKTAAWWKESVEANLSHATWRMYKERKCRCDECVLFATTKFSEWRRKIKGL